MKKKLFLHIILVFISAQLFASNIAVSLKDSIIGIGDLNVLTLRINAPKDERIIFPSAKSISKEVHFEIISDKLEKREVGESITYKKMYSFHSYELGNHLIDSISVRSISDNERSIDYKVPSVFYTTINKYNANKLSPDKDIRRTEYTDYSWIKYLGIGLLAAAIFISAYLFFSRRKRKKEIINEEIEDVITPEEEALLALNELERSAIWKDGHLSAFQAELSSILKTFVENTSDIQALEMTSTKFIQSIDKNNLFAAYSSDLRGVLNIADLVKFAKAEPGEDVHINALNTVRKFVVETSKVNKVSE